VWEIELKTVDVLVNSNNTSVCVWCFNVWCIGCVQVIILSALTCTYSVSDICILFGLVLFLVDCITVSVFIQPKITVLLLLLL